MTLARTTCPPTSSPALLILNIPATQNSLTCSPAHLWENTCSCFKTQLKWHFFLESSPEIHPKKITYSFFWFWSQYNLIIKAVSFYWSSLSFYAVWASCRTGAQQTLAEQRSGCGGRFLTQVGLFNFFIPQQSRKSAYSYEDLHPGCSPSLKANGQSQGTKLTLMDILQE